MRNPNEANENRELVHRFLLHMDSSSWYKNSKRLEAALLYLLELEMPEDHQMKEVYAEVADRTNCDWRTAERLLRYAIHRMWGLHTKDCSNLFYRNDKHTICPCVSEFLHMFHAANERGSIQKWIENEEGRNLSIYGFGRTERYRRFRENRSPNIKIHKIQQHPVVSVSYRNTGCCAFYI